MLLLRDYTGPPQMLGGHKTTRSSAGMTWDQVKFGSPQDQDRWSGGHGLQSNTRRTVLSEIGVLKWNDAAQAGNLTTNTWSQ